MNTGDIQLAKATLSGITAANPMLLIQGVTGATANLLEIKDIGGTLHAAISPTGCPASGLCFDCATGRLTGTSASPRTLGDQTARTTIYYTPSEDLGYIALWNDVTGAFEVIPFTELSLSLSGWAASTNYDIFVVNNHDRTAYLDKIAWTSDFVRATSLSTSGGYLYATGAGNYRYVGTIRTTGTTGQTEDSRKNRFIWNCQNQMLKGFETSYNPGGSWNYVMPPPGGATSISTYQPTNAQNTSNSTTNLRVDWVQGLVGDINMSIMNYTLGHAAGQAGIGMSIDQTCTWNAGTFVWSPLWSPWQQIALNGQYVTLTIYARLEQILTSGHHWMTGLDYIGTGGAATVTFWGGVIMFGCIMC